MFLKAENLLNFFPALRTHIHGTAERHRIRVFNDDDNIHVRLINDDKQVILTDASSPIKVFKSSRDIIEGAKVVGAAIAKNALANGITEVVFDKRGCIFHGFALKLAETMREAGLKFK